MLNTESRRVTVMIPEVGTAQSGVGVSDCEGDVYGATH